MDTIDKQTLWEDILGSIKVSVSEAIFSTWFVQTHLVSLTKNQERYVIEIGCSSNYVKNTIESRYFGLVQDELAKKLSSACDILFIIKSKPESQNSNSEAGAPLFIEKETPAATDLSIPTVSRIRSAFTFENYAVSSSNQMAWAAAEAVAKEPGSAYNPLFVWGGVGVGKTHLMNAVGYSVLVKNSEANVLLCTGEEFTNDIVEGIRNKSTESFRNKYRKLKVLLIDDIQFIAGKDAVQEEFFHTFNALVNSGSQIIMTSDKPPEDIAKLEERLRSRFEAGLIVDIAPPDFELRCAIIQIKARERRMEIPMDMVQLIAGNIDSARKLEGFLVRLTTESNVSGGPITIELIERLLGRAHSSDSELRTKATFGEVISAVSKYYSVGKRQLLGTSRSKPVALPRQVLMYLLRTHLELPLQEVGRLVGGRDHTTVMHAVDKITTLTSHSVNIREDIKGIKQHI